MLARGPSPSFLPTTQAWPAMEGGLDRAAVCRPSFFVVMACFLLCWVCRSEGSLSRWRENMNPDCCGDFWTEAAKPAGTLPGRKKRRTARDLAQNQVRGGAVFSVGLAPRACRRLSGGRKCLRLNYMIFLQQFFNVRTCNLFQGLMEDQLFLQPQVQFFNRYSTRCSNFMHKSV